MKKILSFFEKLFSSKKIENECFEIIFDAVTENEPKFSAFSSKSSYGG